MLNEDQKEIIETPKIRKLIAEKLTLSKSTIPHFYLRRSIYVDNLLSVRKNINDNLDSKNAKISINDFFIKVLSSRRESGLQYHLGRRAFS